MSDRFGYSRKEKREIRQGRQNDVAKDVYIKANADKTIRADKYNEGLFELGADWFNSGMEFEDADSHLKGNSNFKRGYERAKRLADVEKSLYDLGRKHFEEGNNSENIPEKYRESVPFLRGFSDAKQASRGSR